MDDNIPMVRCRYCKDFVPEDELESHEEWCCFEIPYDEPGHEPKWRER